MKNGRWSMKIGFDSEKYIKLQTEEILKRAKMFDNKLYIEFGGKLFDDHHAARVLPGLYPDIKLRVLKNLGDDIEVLYCVSAKDIEKNKIRGDSGLTYDLEVLRGVDELRSNGLFVGNIVIIINLILGIILLINIYKQKQLYGFNLSIYPVWLSIATTLNLALWILN